MQVKTNDIPITWDQKPEDQKVDQKNCKDGREQLERDIIRFMEMLPDVKMRDVNIHYNLAFPLAGSRKEGVLTMEHFEDDHQEDLLKALGIPPIQEPSQPTPVMEDTYKRLVCRYLGPHSQVPSKFASESFRRGLSALQLAKRGTESCLEAMTTESEAQTSKAKATDEKILYKNVKKLCPVIYSCGKSEVLY